MNTELKNAVLATDLKAQYDACAKKLLGYKDILAQILIGAVEEFQRMSPEEVKPLIEEIYILERSLLTQVLPMQLSEWTKLAKKS